MARRYRTGTAYHLICIRASRQERRPCETLGIPRRDRTGPDRRTGLYHTAGAYGYGTTGEHLPRRFLPPGNVTQLHLEYQTETEESGDNPASFKVFTQEFKAFDKLIFRPASDFADCDTCYALRTLLGQARLSRDQKLVAMKELQSHLANVNISRQCEELSRTTSPFFAQMHGERATLVACTDGMDQSHWCTPRMPHLRGPKSLAKLRRPRAKVQGCWLFYYGVFFFIADEVQPHDSSFTVECLARALERVRIIAREKG